MWNFRALFAFPATGFSRYLSSFLSHTNIHTRTHTPLCILFFLATSLSLFLSYVHGNTPDILDSNSIARFSPRKSLPSKWLCPPIPSPCLTISRISLSYLPSRASGAFSIPISGLYSPDCCWAIRLGRLDEKGNELREL